MRVDALALENFRNYARQSVDFAPDCNVICGDNAQGKTNLLEAIVYLSSTRSPRTRLDRELISFHCTQARLSGKIYARQRDFHIEIDLAIGRRRKVQINQVPAKKATDLSDILNTVYFCPEDLLLIRDGASARRRFMDQALSQIRPRYAEALSEYNRLYEHKTRILRDWEDHPDLKETLPDFNLRMAQMGAILIYYRSRFCQRLMQYASAAHQQCSGEREELSLSYETVKTIEDPFAPQEQLFSWLLLHQKEHFDAELASRLCLSGPHKDDISVLINGNTARTYSSQGQTRTAALALKLAEREIFKEITGEAPVLLLDDVLSELDPKRQEFVLNQISGDQVFISCCEEDRLESLLGGKILYVENGKIS